jgi:hypothetical protein
VCIDATSPFGNITKPAYAKTSSISLLRLLVYGGAISGRYVPDQATKGAVVFKWTPRQVFLGAYLAVLSAVVHRILISTVQTQLRLIDPFRQLSSSKGALAFCVFFAICHRSDLAEFLGSVIHFHVYTGHHDSGCDCCDRP